MSLVKPSEITGKNMAADHANGQPLQDPTMPEAQVSSAVARFRQGFYTEAEYGVLLALGEEPNDYQRMMESLLEDLQPRGGLESQLVEQMGQTFWRMRRAQRMQDGLALKRLQRKVKWEEMMAATQASQALELLEPFERLKEALARRGQGPTVAEIDEFVKSRKGDSSEETKEFILLLKSLHEPREEPEQRAARREARTQLRRLMEPYENIAWRYSRQTEKVQSAENLAALMAPEDQSAALLQTMEDSYLRRLWRLTNTLAKVRQGAFQNKKDNDRSQNVYENKQNRDKMPGE